jgi:hypothetical protein
MSTRITGRFDVSHYTSETTISYIRKPEDRDGFVFSGKTTVRMKHDSGGYSLTHLPELALGFETTGVSLFGRTSLKFLETGELARSRTSLDLSIGRRSTLLFRGVHEYEPARPQRRLFISSGCAHTLLTSLRGHFYRGSKPRYYFSHCTSKGYDAVRQFSSCIKLKYLYT